MGKKGQPKKSKVVGRLRYVLAENVKALVEVKFKESTNKPKALSKAAGFSFSTAQRILNAETGPDIETVEAMARAFRLDPYRLLLPDIVAEVERRSPTAQSNPWLSKGHADRRIGERRSDSPLMRALT